MVFHLVLSKQTNCTPWDYPLPKGSEHSPVCTSYDDGVKYFNSLRDFNELMQDPAITDKCMHDCMPNCEEVTYSREMDTTYLDAKHLCEENETRHVILVIFKLNTKYFSSKTYFSDGSIIVECHWKCANVAPQAINE